MKINRYALKSNAKHAIAGSKPNAPAVALVYYVIITVLSLLANAVTKWNEYVDALYSGIYEYGVIPVAGPFEAMSGPGAVIAVMIVIMVYMTGVGFVIYELNVVRMRSASFGNLFDGFGLFFKVIWLGILTNVLVFLWSCLFGIPGIIASYRYRQALYIMLDNPEMSALECIRASKALMRRHKAELFILDFSFVGWYLLSMIPFVSVWVIPYTGITYVYYYETLRGPKVFPGNEAALPPPQEKGGDSGGKPPWEY